MCIRDRSTWVSLPAEIVHYLLEKYGGGPLIKNFSMCMECLIFAKNLKRRKKLERQLIKKYDNKLTDLYYFMDQSWMQQWQNFLYSNNKYIKKNFVLGFPVPGPINNRNLLNDELEPKEGMERNKDFRVINRFHWQILKFLYGGGPEIARTEKNVYSESPVPATMINRQEVIKGERELLEELRDLLNENIIKAEARFVNRKVSDEDDEEVKINLDETMIQSNLNNPQRSAKKMKGLRLFPSNELP
eukprot:TRINITY_DN4616_c0_g1_i1.p1 TRINITY_DN4616_c0_g1~~TRINITY_DN4616_c0_g1_i1.p1  ORF type:complete len:245 (-),score=40.85 TRINITY_DN4616_c0_g1_i1:91-825(-)